MSTAHTASFTLEISSVVGRAAVPVDFLTHWNFAYLYRIYLQILQPCLLNIFQLSRKFSNVDINFNSSNIFDPDFAVRHLSLKIQGIPTRFNLLMTSAGLSTPRKLHFLLLPTAFIHSFFVLSIYHITHPHLLDHWIYIFHSGFGFQLCTFLTTLIYFLHLSSVRRKLSLRT